MESVVYLHHILKREGKEHHHSFTDTAVLFLSKKTTPTKTKDDDDDDEKEKEKRQKSDALFFTHLSGYASVAMMMTVDDFPLTSDDIYTPICDDDDVMCFTSFPFFSSLLSR